MSSDDQLPAGCVSSAASLSERLDAGSDFIDPDSPGSDVQIALGQWAVLKAAPNEYDGDNSQRPNAVVDWHYDEAGLPVENENQYLVCVSDIGSNFVEFSGPKAERHGQKVVRVHLVNFWSRVKLISQELAQSIIARETRRSQDLSSSLLRDIQELTASLGLSKPKSIGNQSAAPTDSTGLVVIHAQPNVEQYALSLQHAKEDLLPALYGRLKDANVHLLKWLCAPSLSSLCQITDMQNHVRTISDRLFSLSLYAGLCESLEKVRDGEPAPIGQKLHVMQRRCYMDEECLVNYKSGGMSFEDIGAFDRWLSESENLERILPFPRCVVAFKVRRHRADRNWDGSLLNAFINIQLDFGDKKTFLYFRNGLQLWRLETEIDFDEKLFPDSAVFDPAEPMMFKLFGASVDGFMPKREYEQLIKEHQRLLDENEKWEREHPYEEWAKTQKRPSRFTYGLEKPRSLHISYELENLDRWEELNSETLYFDDAMAKLEADFKRYNRIATILQGVFDRSEALHPHAPVKLWAPDGFSEAIELVYDANRVLANGEKPDIKAYIDTCNSQIKFGSVVTGQLDYWLKSEANKEMKRRKGDRRLTENERYKKINKFQPIGNPGPPEIAAVNEAQIKRSAITFKWTKDSSRFPYNLIECSVTVPLSELFNISAYRPGDFKQFYQDHRTRAEYLQWAPLLLAAEDWHASSEDWYAMNPQSI